MKILIHLFLLQAAAIAAALPSLPAMGTKPVRFTVLDPAGSPVPDALVEASRAGPGAATGRTGDDGTLELELTAGRTLHVYVSRDGYYTTGGELWTGGIHKGPDGNLVARELPDTFTIELKPVIEPVDLREVKFRGRAPRTSGPAGFDLLAGDWVAPWGRGATPDLLFQFHDVDISPEGFTATMTVAFPNPGDGIQPFLAARPFSSEFGSNLAPPNRAPVDGYQPAISHTLAHRKGKPYESYVQPRRNYLIRTRTVLDPSGTIRQACYGWIQGEIEFDPRDPMGTQLVFTAYLNPDPHPEARSLESRKHAPKSP